MTKVKLIGNLAHDGVEYKAGEVFEGDKAVVDNLIALGAAQDPKTVEPGLNETAVEDAEAKAAKILEAAQAKVDSVLAAAKDEAEKVVAKAEAVLAQAASDAEKLVAAAKDEAEKLVNAAKPASATSSPTPAGGPQKPATTTSSK